MPKFTVTEELFNTVDDLGQSIGGPNHTIPSGDNNIVVSKERGLELEYENPFNYGGSTTIVEELDLRKTLGTITLNNRDYWENINYNQSTFTPYLTDERKTVITRPVEDSNGDEIVYNPNLEASSTYQYSIDALPFVLDANNDNEIINVDRYWDKKINSNEYYLATEGKINYYLYPRRSGRGESFGTNYNIDIFGNRGKKTASGGKNRFSVYAAGGDGSGYYLFKLNWGDGSPLEYTNQPKLLEGTTLLEHFYEKPGFYTITGTVYASFKNKRIDAYEQFETNILLNPSKNYEFKLYDYDNFASIGGISLDSTLIKSGLNNIGINPIDFNDDKSSVDLIEKINLLDKLQLFNFLNKVSGSFLNKFEDLINPYTQAIDGGTTLTIFGCADPNADNYQEGVVENGTCAYGYNITFDLDEDNSGTIKFYTLDLDGDLTLVDNDYYLETSILSYSNEFIGSELTFSRDNLPTSTFGNPKIFVKFFNSAGQEIGNGDPVINGNLTQLPIGIQQLEVRTYSVKENAFILRPGWYVLTTPDLPEPNDEYNRNTIDGQIIFDVADLEQIIDDTEDDDTFPTEQQPGNPPTGWSLTNPLEGTLSPLEQWVWDGSNWIVNPNYSSDDDTGDDTGDDAGVISIVTQIRHYPYGEYGVQYTYLIEDYDYLEHDVNIGMVVDIDGVGGEYEIVDVTASQYIDGGLEIRLDNNPAISDNNWVDEIIYDVTITGVSI